MNGRGIAVLIPCYNEAVTIAKVVEDFARELPDAEIYVYDNNSSDATASIAAEHGAVVRHEQRQGKGNVARQMLRDIDADFYVMVDGDDTYPAEAVHEMLAPLLAGQADMVIGDRLSNRSYHKENRRAFHSFGNSLVRWLVRMVYRVDITDVLTGYRAFSRCFAKGLPVLSKGFEVETELTIHSIDKNWRVAEVAIDYRDRPEGSVSKLSTISDGIKVTMTIMALFKDYRPLKLFTAVGFLLIAVGLAFGTSVIIEFARTGLVERLPTAILAVGLVFSGLLSLVCGIVLDTNVKSYRKQYELHVMQLHEQSRHAGKAGPPPWR